MSAAAVEREARAEDQTSLRSSPEGWDDVTKALNGMARSLKHSLESIRTYGHYTALGVGVDASDTEVKRSYREMCLKCHPDKGGDTICFQQLQQAYETVLDERRRGV